MPRCPSRTVEYRPRLVKISTAQRLITEAHDLMPWFFAETFKMRVLTIVLHVH